MNQNIFLLAGRTGGPLLPVLAIAKNLKNVNPIVLGIKLGFEEEIVRQNGYILELLPESKFSFLSFKSNNIKELFKGFLSAIISLWRFKIAFWKSVFLLIKYKPKLIISAGSFLAVPVIFASQITNFFKFTNTKNIIHQQDPLPGLANNLTVKFANLSTAVFPYTKNNFPKFKNVEIIPNPINFQAFDESSQAEWVNQNLSEFFSEYSKPVFLIFGGGSGSMDINNWVLDNLEKLVKDYKVIHLTGQLQTVKLPNFNNANYLRLTSVIEDMPKLLSQVNLVLCRAGMGSITELEYLGKNAFLVPLPNSHQEINANLVKDKFVILEQKNMDNWLEIIKESFPIKFIKVEVDNSKNIKKELRSYFAKVQNLIK